MHQEPLVFIILVNWNGKQVTLECLESLKKITYTEARTVVVDNASSDGSVEAIQRAFPEVLILRMNENLRFAGGNNAGIRYALDHGAALILLLNNDTTVDSDFLQPMVQRMTDDRRCGMVAPKIYYSSPPDILWFAGGIVSLWTGTMRHRGIRESDHGQYDLPGPIDYASGCCVLVRREVVESIGLLDESYFMYTEDADWSLRARRAGYSIQYEPRARIWHRLSVSAGGHLSWYKMQNKFISNLRFFSRYAAWYQWLVFPWLNLALNGLAAIRYFATTRR